MIAIATHVQRLFESGSTGNNLKKFLGDSSLTSTIVFHVQCLSELTSVITGRLHGRHTGSELGGDGFLESTEDLSVEVERKDGVDDLEWLLLEDHIVWELLWVRDSELGALDAERATRGGELEDLISSVRDIGSRERNQGTGSWYGGDEGHELRVKKLNGISLAGEVSVEELLGDGKALLGIWVLSTLKGLADWVVTTHEVLDSLLSDENKVNVNSLGLELLVTGVSLLDHEGVVSSAKTTVTSDNNKSNLLDLTLSQQRKIDRFTIKTGDKSTENRLKSLRERTGGHNGILGTTHFSGSDKLHGHGNLTGVDDGLDTITDSCIGSNSKTEMRKGQREGETV
jgi:hypothetical protein